MTKNNLNYIDEEVRKLRTENEIDRQQERTDAVAMTYRDGAASAGEQTMVSLNAARYEGDDAAADTESAPAPGGFSYEPYKPSDAVTQAEALLQEQLGKKPGEYTSQWQAQLEETIGKILNREKFSYDLNEDALYQQYKDSYIRQGQMAMMDTMGQAQAMTGGYGNSYAQGVGQQAYQSHLQNLNDIVPELYRMALDRYIREGDDLLNQYGILGAQEEQEYGRYRDAVSDYYNELQRLTEDARYQGELDYGRWADDRNFAYGQFADDRAYNYQLSQDEFAKQEAAAQLMASVGDYSLLGQLYGLTEEQIAALSGETKKKSGGGGDNLFTNLGTNLGAALAGIVGDTPTGFTGTTYSEAVSYLNSQGVSNANSSMIMTRDEFSRVKASGSSKNGEHKLSNYQEYLQYAVDNMISIYGKK